MMYLVEKNSFIIVKGGLLKECERIGTERYDNNRNSGVKEQMYAKRNPLEISIQGVIVEMATSIMFKFAICDILNTKPNSIHRDRGDMLVEGKRIDIKGPYGHDKPLMVRHHSTKNPSDIYMLCTIEQFNDGYKVIFKGCIPSKILLLESNMINQFNQQFYTMKQSQLMTLEQALTICNY